MGLDMYLDAKMHLSEFSTNKELFDKVYEFVPYKYEDNYARVSLEFPVGYWRKVNWIHKWFVDNVQDGNDNCESYYVDTSKLEELKSLVSKFLEAKDIDVALEQLPSQSGFFFGTTEISAETEEWYWNSLEDTKDILTKAVELAKKGYSIYYQSSW